MFIKSEIFFNEKNEKMQREYYGIDEDHITSTLEYPYIEEEPIPEPAQPTNQDIMDKLNTMTTGQVSTAELDAAYREGVNAYV